jgi:predicted esterase YcpF (UPF0227 family)
MLSGIIQAHGSASSPQNHQHQQAQEACRSSIIQDDLTELPQTLKNATTNMPKIYYNTPVNADRRRVTVNIGAAMGKFL